MAYSVLLLSRYGRKGPSSRVRHYQFVPILERAGFRVTVAPLLGEEYLNRLYRGEPRSFGLLAGSYLRRLRDILSARQYDLIWIEKEALPWMPALLERALIAGRPYIVDFDDPWYLRYSMHPNLLIRSILGRKLEAIVAHAHTVTVGSVALEQWAVPAQPRHLIEIPPVVDVDRYAAVPPPNDLAPIIGWIGTPTTENYLKLIADPLRRLHAAYGMRLRVIGGSGRLILDGIPIDHVEWREETESIELSHCLVGVMPMSDGAWERGKCGYKLIQYMAAGRAVVASPVGSSLAIVRDRETGFLAGSPDEWFARLSELVRDRDRAYAMGRAGRQLVTRAYSLQIVAPQLVMAIADAIGTMSDQERTRAITSACSCSVGSWPEPTTVS